MNWKAGDRAIMINCVIIANEGQECTITGPMEEGIDRITFEYYMGWPIECATGLYVSYPHCLKPISYDGNEKTSWSECAWQPKELVVVG